MYSEEDLPEQDDTIRMGLQSRRGGKLFPQEPDRFQAITKKLSMGTTMKQYQSPMAAQSAYKEVQQSPQHSILLPRVILLNGQQFVLRCQAVVTSKGVCYILKLRDRWINLSWIHSIKKIEKAKLLLLYYHMSPVTKDKKPTLQPQLLEFRGREELEDLYRCILSIHGNTHDDQIQKLYHQLI